jgi:hypothetical protein
MSNKTTEMLRTACKEIGNKGIKLERGAWLTIKNDKIIACDAILAALIHFNKVWYHFDMCTDGTKRPFVVNDMLTTAHEPGFVRAACGLLNVDGAWITRFLRGWDQNTQIVLTDEGDKQHRDEVSGFAITLAKEFKI